MKLTAKIEAIKIIAKNTAEVDFLVPAGEFNFRAGQYVSVTLPSLKNLELREQFRDFSIASSPTELPRLSISFRVSESVFKQTLLAMGIGDEIIIEGPAGVFTLPESGEKPLVFIAGGIGIDPFRSMLKFVTEKNLPYKITLLYFNRSAESAAYLAELETLSQKNPSLKIVNVLGPLEEKHISDLMAPEAIWYIAGPPGMVHAAREVLTKNGIMDINIKTEEFSGYRI